MSNIYLKVIIETFSKLRFSGFKSEVRQQNYVWLFFYFNFERNYDVLKSKSPCILLNKKYIKSQIKSKTVMSWRQEGIFCTVCFVRREFCWDLWFSSMYSVLNALSEYLYLYISKYITLYTFFIVIKIVESLQCISKKEICWRSLFKG